MLVLRGIRLTLISVFIRLTLISVVIVVMWFISGHYDQMCPASE